MSDLAINETPIGKVNGVKISVPTALLNEEFAIEQFWERYKLSPTSVVVNPALLEHMAMYRFGGGNSHQRRKWYRQWSPTRFKK